MRGVGTTWPNKAIHVKYQHQSRGRFLEENGSWVRRTENRKGPQRSPLFKNLCSYMHIFVCVCVYYVCMRVNLHNVYMEAIYCFYIEYIHCSVYLFICKYICIDIHCIYTYAYVCCCVYTDNTVVFLTKSNSINFNFTPYLQTPNWYSGKGTSIIKYQDSI